MTTEDDLRRALTASTPTTEGVDAARVIAAARRRRRPRVALATGAGALAVVGVLALGLPLALGTSPSAVTLGAADTAAGGADSPMIAPESLEADAARSAAVPLCGEPAPTASPDPAAPLALELSIPATIPAGSTVDGTVRLTNRGAERFIGTAAPAAALTVTAPDGTVVWHSNGPVILTRQALDLAPGATVELTTSVTAVRCGPEDDALPAFRETLPGLDAGGYAVTAALEVASTAGASEVLVSAAESVTVR